MHTGTWLSMGMLWALAACGDGTGDPDGADRGPGDAGWADGGPAPTPDQGEGPDLAAPDAEARDLSAPDLGAAPVDAAPAPDQAPPDLGPTDLGPADLGPTDLGPAPDAAAPDVGPTPEQCDALDNDGDGAVDEGTLNVCGACGPVPPEACDGLDNDCDGRVDEALLNCACNPNTAWRRYGGPGGAAGAALGHDAGWRAPVPPVDCWISGPELDACQRFTDGEGGVRCADADGCAGCAQTFTYRYRYDDRGQLLEESAQGQDGAGTPLTEFDIIHSYDDAGLRRRTRGFWFGQGDRVRELVATWRYGPLGMEAMFVDWVDDATGARRAWQSIYVFQGNLVEEHYDEDDDGQFDGVRTHPF